MTAPAGQAADTWPGCHGVRVAGGQGRFGESTGSPLADIEIRVGEPAEPGRRVLWSQALPDGSMQRATTGSGGEYVVEVGPLHRVSLSRAEGVVTAADPVDWVETQLVASFVIPFLVSGGRTLVLHAAAASRSGQAVIFAGPGGTGKSSSLVGLAEAGWAPLSEDVCVIDLSGPEPLVWPGPPWVRRMHGEPGPRGSKAMFESSEKTAWDLGPFRVAPAPAPVAGIFLLDAPSTGAQTERTALGRGEAVGALAPHAVWLGDGRETGRRLFGPVTVVASRVPVSVLRLPRRRDWVDLLVRLLD